MNQQTEIKTIRKKRTAEQMVEFWQEKVTLAKRRLNKVQEYIKKLENKVVKAEKRIEIKKTILQMKAELNEKIKQIKTES
ncbi:MAG: hypothetical protein AB1567_04565 [bacterium]